MAIQGHSLVSVSEKVSVENANAQLCAGVYCLWSLSTLPDTDSCIEKASRNKGCSHQTSKPYNLGVIVLFSPSFNIQGQSCPPIPEPTGEPSRICIHTPERKSSNVVLPNTCWGFFSLKTNKQKNISHQQTGYNLRETRKSLPYHGCQEPHLVT